MLKAIFYVPENFNNNVPIPKAVFDELNTFLIVEFGGVYFRWKCGRSIQEC